jgi:non-heme chloroperoxidase
MRHGHVVVSDGTRLHYIEAGAGQPLLLIPGWSLPASGFRLQIEGLCDRRRVIAIDMRGHGESDRPERGYRIQRLAKDLFDAIGALGVECPDVLGHSMGASVLFSYLSLFGEERPLGRLVIVDQAPCVLAQPGWDDADRAEAGCLLPDMAALAGFEAGVLASGEVEAVREILRGMFTGDVPEEQLDEIAAESAKMPRVHAAHLLHDHCVIDWRTEIAAIRNPCLVIGGEASIFPAQSQRWIAAQIPGAEVEIFEAEEGGSHFMFIENPERFNARVAAFLG